MRREPAHCLFMCRNGLIGVILSRQRPARWSPLSFFHPILSRIPLSSSTGQLSRPQKRSRWVTPAEVSLLCRSCLYRQRYGPIFLFAPPIPPPKGLTLLHLARPAAIRFPVSTHAWPRASNLAVLYQYLRIFFYFRCSGTIVSAPPCYGQLIAIFLTPTVLRSLLAWTLRTIW